MNTRQVGALPRTTPSPPVRRRRRLRRWGRRGAIGLVGLLALITVVCLATNQLTDGRVPVPRGMGYVQAGDVPTRIRSWGDTGSPVVLVHGAAETADTWAPVADLLSTDHRVYALDLDGWGYTRRVAPYDLDHQTRQLLDTLRVLHLIRPVLVGHSSGAAIIAEAALREPGSIGGLLLLDGDALDTGAGARTPARHLLLPPYRTTVLRLAVGSDRLIRAIYQSQCGPRCPRLDAAGVEAWRRPFQVPGAEAALWDLLDLGVPGMSPARLEGLAALPMPKSVAFGAQDGGYPAGTPERTAARIGAPPPTLIPAARHLTMISDPVPVATAIRTLISRTPAPPS